MEGLGRKEEALWEWASPTTVLRETITYPAPVHSTLAVQLSQGNKNNQKDLIGLSNYYCWGKSISIKLSRCLGSRGRAGSRSRVLSDTAV